MVKCNYIFPFKLIFIWFIFKVISNFSVSKMIMNNNYKYYNALFNIEIIKKITYLKFHFLNSINIIMRTKNCDNE